MKIIITGGTGFIGRHLAESFHKDGIEILATGRSPEAGKKLTKAGIKFEPADITDSDKLVSIFTPADIVIHCAARYGDHGTKQEFFETNIAGTRNVIRACKKHDIRKIIFISTPSIYYNGKDRFKISESDPLPKKQATHYGRTKLICESELLALAEEGFKTIIFRPRAVYGPYDKTIMYRILKLSERKKFPLINNGRALADITSVYNLVDAVKKCLNAADDIWNEVYNISNDEPISMKEWFSEMLKALDRPFKPKNIPEGAAKIMGMAMYLLSLMPFGPKRPPLTPFAVGYMAKSMTMSIEKAKEKLSYSPPVDNKEGFRRLSVWYHSALDQD
ncbi:MAG: NAD-dependent epimerase/dehydratase family protein [candidate division Zixibacteria bacterium]|nr:NAD-dependent epimerase/dehydratase family protein [candidate division Zixibacteria bacterium]